MTLSDESEWVAYACPMSCVENDTPVSLLCREAYSIREAKISESPTNKRLMI